MVSFHWLLAETRIIRFMIFLWIFTSAALFLTIFLEQIDSAKSLPGAFYLLWLLIFAMPFLLMWRDFLNNNCIPKYTFFSKKGVFGIFFILLFLGFLWGFFHISLGTILFLFALLLTCWFQLDGRISYSVAFVSLVTTIFFLLWDRKDWAENASIITYYSLVIGVLSELISPAFDKIKLSTKPILTLNSESKKFFYDYKRDISLMSYILLTVMIAGFYILQIFHQIFPMTDNFYNTLFFTILALFVAYFAAAPRFSLENFFYIKYFKNFWLVPIFISISLLILGFLWESHMEIHWIFASISTTFFLVLLAWYGLEYADSLQKKYE